MTNKSIGMLLDAFYPADIRVHKEATALIDAGFQVALLCKRRADEPETEVVDGINVMRIDAGKTNFDKGILDILLSISFIHPIFRKRIREFIERFNLEIIHVHDLPLVKTAVMAAKRNNVITVADFHENYAEALKVWFQWKKNPVIRIKNRIFFGFNRWMKYESWASHKVDYIIAVVEEMKQRLVSDHAIDATKVVVVTNSESKDFINQPLNTDIYGQDTGKFIIAYTGGVGPHRGVDTAIEGIAELKQIDNLVFYIVGSVTDAVRTKLEQLIADHGLEAKIRVLGYRPFEQFYSYMKMADVNIVPHHSNGHTDHTIPHKLYQCMMTGKPLLVSSSAPLKRVVEATESGLVFDAGNSIDLGAKVIQLYNDEKLRRQLGENGKQATLVGNYNWQSTSQVLVNFYNKVFDQLNKD